MFVKMPKKDSVVYAVRTTSLRRSPRFLRHKVTPEQERPTPLRKSPRLALQKKTSSQPEGLKSKSRNSRVSSHGVSLGPEEHVLKNSKESFMENIRKETRKCNDGSRNFGNLSSRTKRSSVLNRGVDGFPCLRRSPRIADQYNVMACEHKDCPEKTGKKSVESDDGPGNCGNSRDGSTQSSRSCNDVYGFQSLRRSPRFFGAKNDSETTSRAKGISNGSKNKVELPDIGKAEMGVNSRERAVPKTEKPRRSCLRPKAVDAGGSEMESSEFDDGYEDVEVGSKRKRGEEGMTVQGWTREQELALQRAYLVAKPTPGFWKKVSKLVCCCSFDGLYI